MTATVKVKGPEGELVLGQFDVVRIRVEVQVGDEPPFFLETAAFEVMAFETMSSVSKTPIVRIRFLKEVTT